MPRHAHILPLIAVLALLSGCSGSRSYAKKAAQLDAAGMYAEAADMYLQAVQRNAKNVEAKIGLKQAGQRLLDDKLGTFFKTVNMDQDRAAAVKSFLEARAYQERVGRLGVVLDIPDHYRTEFERVKGEHLVDLYNRGQALLEQQDFAAAERTFSEIAKLEPGYKDASSLQAVAYLEPLYRAGKADFDAGRYRKAYEGLNKVVTKDAGYKDASELMQQAITKGQFSIAVLPFTATAKAASVRPKVQAYAITALTSTRDPFLKVVDRENIDRILEEQRLSLSGVVDEQTAVRVGNLIGAQAVLMGEVVDYREEPGTLRRSTKEAFESYRQEQINKETGEKYYVTKYRPVTYTEYLHERRVIISFSYRLVSLETGEVLVSKVVDQQATDQAYYATYTGNRDALLPKANGVVDLSNNARNQLRSLLNAPREVKSVADLSNEVVNTSCSAMARTIQQELSSRLP
jgi:curli biogenesis system outer membrane secretion channel CsgG